MSLRIDTAELIPGAYVVGDVGLGVLGADIPGDGEHGPSFLYNDLTLADALKEVRGLIVTPPASGTLFAHEDGSFDFAAPADGSYTFTYRLFVDGVDLGTAVASVTIGTASGTTGAVAGTAAYTITGTGAVAGTVESGGGETVTGSAAGVAAYTIGATGAVSGTVTDAAAATEPVTLAEAKLAARISGTSDFDSLIPGLISAARQMAEQETGRELVRKVRRHTFDNWPDAGVVLPVYGAASVAISYWDGSAWTALDGSAFVFFESSTGTGIAPAIGTTWPALGAVAGGARVRVDITAGPADPTTADACVKQYIKALVAWWIDNPSAAAPGNVQPAPYLRSLLDPVRIWA